MFFKKGSLAKVLSYLEKVEKKCRFDNGSVHHEITFSFSFTCRHDEDEMASGKNKK